MNVTLIRSAESQGRLRPRRGRWTPHSSHTRWLSLAAVLSLTLSAAATASRTTPLSFDRLSLREGLSQSTVMDIHQDAFGFIWLATENGLNRFDGHKMRTYYRQAGNPDGLRSDFIWTIAEDANGDLWIGTNDAGVMRWDRSSDRFEVIQLTTADGEVLKDARVYDLLSASDGTIWAGTRRNGVLAFTPQGQPFAQFLDKSTDPGSARLSAITSLIEDEDGSIWVGSQRGVHRIERPSNTVTSYIRDRENSNPSADLVSRVLKDQQGRIWIATFDSGVFRLNPDTGEFTSFPAEPEAKAALPSNRVRALLEDDEGRIWIGTQDGIALVFPDGTSQIVRHEPANQFSLPNDFVMSFTQDDSGLIWVGTRGGGAAIWNPRSWSLGPRTPEVLSGIHVNAFLEQPDNSVWVGTIGSGLLHLDGSGTAEPAAPAALYDLGQDSVMSLLRDTNGTVWIGTLADGLLRYEPNSNTITSPPVSPRRKDALGAAGVMSLAEGPPGTIWVGTYNGGVARIDAASRSIERLGFDGALSGLERVRATALTVVQDQELWIGTEANGLVRMQLDSGKVTRFHENPNQSGGLPSDTIYSLHADAQANLWIGTGALGLVKLSRESLERGDPTFSLISSADGLSSNVIFGIESDVVGRLWLSSNNGLMRLDPSTTEIRSFHQGHGSFSDEFNFGAHHKAPDGTLYFGGPGGFNVFNPTAVEWNTQPPRILLTDILLFGAPAAGGIPPYLRDSLQLAHDENVIAFEFAATDYAAPERNLYSVKLDGFDKTWSPPSPRNRATYTNLDPGHYTLMIRASNSDGVWTPEPLTLPIHVARPPWGTWWAYACYAAAAMFLLWWLLRLNFKAQERKARLNQLAFYDRITGLPNRELFEQRANDVLSRQTDHENFLAVLCIRIFVPRQITQSLPQQLLNDMWQTLASRLMRAVHGHEQTHGRRDLARLDSDHFLVFIETDSLDDSQPFSIGERLRLICTESLTIGQHRVPIAASVGMARAPQHAPDADTLIRYAATAASSQSHPQADGVLVYSKEMTARLESRLALETRLRLALANDELQLHLQAKVDSDKVVMGAEALLRWHSKDLGWIPPTTFVAVAEESDLIVELDTWVIRKVCSLLASTEFADLGDIQIAINISAANLGHLGIVNLLIQTCEEFGVQPHRLEVELTESALLTDMEQTREALRQLKSHGFSIALDDFGTGYSSLTHLKTFAIDTVKIDREFVRGVDSEDQQATICNAIVALAKSLDLHTVAEGVETEEQYEALRALGCDAMQGYLFAKPVPAADFAQFVRQSPARVTNPQ